MGYPGSQAELFAAQMAFFDDVLNGRNPASPLVRYFRCGSNTWHASDVWPLAGVEQRSLYMDGDVLADAPSAADWSRGYVSDPAAPVPTVGGCTFLPGMIVASNSGPKEQAAVERRSDVMLFTSPPLEIDTEVTGLVVAHLWVKSSAPTCDWTVKLCEVDRLGNSIGRVDGILRWTNGATGPGEPVEVVVKLGHMSHLFPAGHRLRLQVASSNFPRFDRNPQSGVSSVFARAEDLSAATQTICGGARRQSCVVLPVVTSPGGGATSLTAVTDEWKRAQPARE
jgi:putative CocE/NonD family hydrolase